jgi:hypothetical protein
METNETIVIPIAANMKFADENIDLQSMSIESNSIDRIVEKA